jgi:glycosyltransferase involved in cell wall biosynthesis
VLSNIYDVKLVVTTDGNEITNAYNWADIVWLEWANEMAVQITNKLPKMNKKILCRLHSYEALSHFPEQINWQNVDKLILVADHIREILEIYHEKVYQRIKDKITVIHNGLDLSKFTFKIHQPGYNIAVVAHINHKKDPAMWLQIIEKLKNIDKRYVLHIAGDFQDIRYSNYFKYFIKEANLEKNVKLYGFVNDVNAFLEDKNYLLSTSIHEGHPYNIMEAMARGIKPIIHNFAGANKLYPKSLIFNFIDEAVEKITQAPYDSVEYREYLMEKGWTLENMQKSIKDTLDNLTVEDFKKKILGGNMIDEFFEYLKGEKFSNSLKFEVTSDPEIVYRLEFLKEISKNKNIIHIGFTDHKDLILDKMKKGIWLHKLLLDSAKLCVGIDINCESVNFVRDELNIDNVYCIDILKDEIPEDILNINWDFVILGEVIEHIDNPVLFLKELREKIGKISKK